MFISSYTTIYFFLKKFIFSNVYISLNTIFECLYYVFWLRKGPSIKYVRNCWGGWGCHPKCVQLRIGGGGIKPNVYVLTLYLHYLFSCFWQHFCPIVYCFICRNLTLLYSKKFCSSEKVIFLQQDQILSSSLRLNILGNKEILRLFI